MYFRIGDKILKRTPKDYREEFHKKILLNNKMFNNLMFLNHLDNFIQ